VSRRALLLAAVLLLAGCGGVQTLSFPTPSSTTPTTSLPVPTLPNNLESVAEGGVPGVTTTLPVAMGPGAATLTGTVMGPNGPVGGATVQADRIVGDGGASTQTTTAANGTWSIPNILGGRYRVRAWQSPSLALTTPQIFFLGATQNLSLTLQMTSYTGPQIEASIAPGTPIVGQVANLVVQVTNPTVSSAGVVEAQPEVGVSVTLDGSGWQISNGNPQATNSAGQALFQVSCQAAGSAPLNAQVGSGPPVPLQVPSCSPPPTTTTTSLPTFTPCPTVPATGSTTTSTTLFPGLC
jgi:hypothetical protein